jgi:hypothetical protein
LSFLGFVQGRKAGKREFEKKKERKKGKRAMKIQSY